MKKKSENRQQADCRFFCFASLLNTLYLFCYSKTKFRKHGRKKRAKNDAVRKVAQARERCTTNFNKLFRILAKNKQKRILSEMSSKSPRDFYEILGFSNRTEWCKHGLGHCKHAQFAENNYPQLRAHRHVLWRIYPTPLGSVKCEYVNRERNLRKFTPNSPSFFAVSQLPHQFFHRSVGGPGT